MPKHIYSKINVPLLINYFIMGISNLTDAGLGRKPSSNIELNIAETGNNATYNELNLWFADQWKSVAQEKILIDPKNKKIGSD